MFLISTAIFAAPVILRLPKLAGPTGSNIIGTKKDKIGSRTLRYRPHPIQRAIHLGTPGFG